MKNNVAVFPAIVSFYENNYRVDFIDLEECSGFGSNIQDACAMAQRKMCLFLQAHPGFPKPNLDFSHVQLNPEKFIILISADMDIFRDTRMVKKTLTIPSWLNDLAIEKKVNFSQVLQNALKEQLGFLEKIE